MRAIAEGVYCIYIGDTGPRDDRLPMYAYVVLDDAKKRALLIDTTSKATLAALHELVEKGTELAGMLITHRHSVGLADAWAEIMEMLRGKPILLHPSDAAHEQASKWGGELHYEDPIAHPLLAGFHVECKAFPGHTSGGVMTYHASTGVLFVGDSAMTNAEEKPQKIQRPPAPLSADDALLCQSWRAFDATCRVFHGIPIENPTAEMLATLRAEEPTRADALVAYVRAEDIKSGKTYIKD
jgi:glyoxylase-like metal-dependent hydrolase (beta-lactamase superfamily II)